MDNLQSASKVGVFVDTSNLYRNGGHRMQYDVLRAFAARDGAELVRLNVYVSYDPERARTDPIYERNANRFYSVLRDFGYKVIIKEVKWYEDESGKRYGKANADLDLAVDMLMQSENLERVLLATGDGDFTRVVAAVQHRGCRVEVMALDNASTAIRREADMFISGYLIPGLIPIEDRESQGREEEMPWGKVGSAVRGTCYFHKPGYGFMRYLKQISPNLWMTDTQNSSSPYAAAYFRDSSLPEGIDPQDLPSYNHIFEFELAESNVRPGTFEAVDIQQISWVPS